ncbi:MAG: glutamate synthase [Chloroflexi bacterium]|nr:MAG: glutamate synthase [Chloroflexota bacterium]MBL1193475.1 glutamate synthase [Chloroflexota bacterium]NOH10766.1 Rieske 2Fe-2S domain-containing protein [Chloroflexota bacterium]
MSADLVKVATVEDCPPGKVITVSVDNVDIALCNFDGQFYALNNRCPHRGGQLGDGKLVGSDLICPLHSWDFDVRTGISRYDNQDKVTTYPVTIEDGAVYLNSGDVPNEPRDYDDYLSQWRRPFDDREESMNYLHSLAKGKKSVLEPMRTEKDVPLFESLTFLPGGISKLPLLDDEPVQTRLLLGPRAKQPLELRIPVYISHMSYGSLSAESKTSLAMGAKQFGTAVCSGEGGMHPMEREAAGDYIFEMSTGYFGFDDETVNQATAIDFKFGQAAKSGLGGILPAGKNTPEIAAVRGVEPATEVHSPSRFPDLNSLDEIKARVERLRTLTDGPIGAKMAANRIEADLEAAMYCGFDFVTFDGRGGGTGAAPVHVKDNIGVPLVYALPRARRWLDENGYDDVTLVATGGMRTPSDFAKALALGADCVAISTAAMMAIGCQQYRACHNNTCPVGIATQKSDLRARFDMQVSAQRLVNFLEAAEKQFLDYCRMIGYRNIAELSLDDLVTTDMALTEYAGVRHAAQYYS